MGLGKLLSFVRRIRNSANLSDVKVNPGGGPNVTAEHFSAPGDDAHPLVGDYVVIVPLQRSGGSAVVGYLDPKNDQKAALGEKRIYARNSAGVSVVELWLKNTGEATLVNDNGYATLLPNGEVLSNGARITTDGDVITSDGVSLRNHTHLQNDGNDAGGGVQTDPSTPTE
jgi:hypothetical protein